MLKKLLQKVLKPAPRPKSAAPIEWVIAGLGNPGSNYSNTRHNIGWMVCDALCKSSDIDLAVGQGPWLEARLTISDASVLVVKPTTYMNNSGEAVAALQRLFAVDPERILIVVDEVNFPLGKVHLKSGGSDGGHNGLASLMAHLPENNFLRLRCGIGRNFAPGGLVDYVLAPFDKDEVEKLDLMINHALEAVHYLLRHGSSRAMSAVNSESLWRESPPEADDEMPGKAK